MQAQDAPTDYFFKLWPWIEANAKRLVIGAAVVIIAIFLISLYSWRKGQNEIAAGEALTMATVSDKSGQPGEDFLKIAANYPDTGAGKRALLQGAAALFTAGKYADAQAQFQKFLDDYPENDFAPQAALGVAASLDAQGKTSDAANAYQRAINENSDVAVVAAGKFGLARIDAEQGKISEAQILYQDVARAFPGTSLASEAAMRANELKTKMPPVSPSIPTTSSRPATTVPFNLSH